MTDKSSGLTLIEVVTVLAVLAILIGILLPFSSRVLDQQRREETFSQLDFLKRAMSGSPVIIVNEARTSFGYIGDMGGMPAQLEDLWEKGSLPTYFFDSIKKAGAGWNGPYLERGLLTFIDSLGRDPWGRLIDYDTFPDCSCPLTDCLCPDPPPPDPRFFEPATKAVVLARVRSAGPDGVFDSSDDITAYFFQSEVQSTVFGLVKDSQGNAVTGVRVTVNRPPLVVPTPPAPQFLSSTSVFTDSDGFYKFERMYFGNRSITIEPKLVLAAGSLAVTGVNSDTVELVIQNFSANDITIVEFKADYVISPTVYYTTLRVDGQQKFSDSNNRKGTGESINFSGSPVTTAGTGLVSESIPIRIQSAVTEIPDLIIGKIGRGGSARVEMRDFRDARSGGNVPPGGMHAITLTLTFTDSLGGTSIIEFFTP